MNGQHALYANLAPTLGPRIVPSLFKRLEAAAEKGDLVLVRTVVEGIAAVDSDEIPDRATAMLNHSSRYVQRAAACVLKWKPTAAALDRLWVLHCECYADPRPFLWQHEDKAAGERDTFAALRSCVASNPDWLESTIKEADARSQPIHHLATLVANVEDGGELWRRCKAVLFEKVPPRHERSLAINIDRFRDPEEIAWLMDRVHRTDNLVGPMALRALIRMNPGLALEVLDQVPHQELYLTRNWCVAELLARLPQETRSRLLARLRAHEDPWQLAMVFQGRENAIDVPILEFLLDSLADLLDVEQRTSGSENAIGRWILAFELILAMEHPDLIDGLRRRRASPLERNLTNWLLSRGPQRGICMEREKHGGLRVLAKIGGEGLTTVVNQWLDVGDRYARVQAMPLALRRADSTTIDHLVRISQSDELWDGFPVEQGNAAKALAALGDLRHVVAYILRWGQQTLADVTDYLRHTETLNHVDLAPALASFRSRPSPGAVLAMGFGDSSEYISAVRACLERADAESDVARACVIALGRLQDTDRATVPLLVRQLAVPSHRHNAVVALLQIGTDAALEALLRHMQGNYEHGAAVALLNNPRTVAAAIPLVQQRLSGENVFAKLEMIRALFMGVSDRAVVDQIVSEVGMRDFLREYAFGDEDSTWIVATRWTAIRCLGRFDREAAFLAAETTLRNADNHDRELYPYLLVELDASLAVKVLLEQAQNELSTSVTWAISRALALVDYSARLRDLLASADAMARRAACRLAGRLPADDWLVAEMKARLEDTDNSVATAARESLTLLEDTIAVGRLVDAIRSETDVPHRWALLDALLDIGDPGDIHQPWPDWANSINECLPIAMRFYLGERLAQRRKEVLEVARKKDK